MAGREEAPSPRLVTQPRIGRSQRMGRTDAIRLKGRRCALPRSTPSRLLASLALLLGVALAASSVRANDARQRLDQFKKKAVEAESRGAWLEACRFYDELVRKSPD